MEEAVFHFLLDGKPVSCQRYGCGHINRTYLVKTDAGRRYIFQRINSLVFPDIKGLMENIAAVTGFLAARVEEPRGSLRLVPALDGAWVWVDGEGESWRVYDFIEDSLCLQQPERPEDLYESAVAFGCFQNQLSDFPADTLHETIKDFHNTPDRYRKFHLALEADALGRAAGVREEIDFALKREAAARGASGSAGGRLPAPAGDPQRYKAQQCHAGRQDPKGSLRHRPGHGDAGSCRL